MLHTQVFLCIIQGLKCSLAHEWRLTLGNKLVRITETSGLVYLSKKPVKKQTKIMNNVHGKVSKKCCKTSRYPL